MENEEVSSLSASAARAFNAAVSKELLRRVEPAMDEEEGDAAATKRPKRLQIDLLELSQTERESQNSQKWDQNGDFMVGFLLALAAHLFCHLSQQPGAAKDLFDGAVRRATADMTVAEDLLEGNEDDPVDLEICLSRPPHVLAEVTLGWDRGSRGISHDWHGVKHLRGILADVPSRKVKYIRASAFTCPRGCGKENGEKEYSSSRRHNSGPVVRVRLPGEEMVDMIAFCPHCASSMVEDVRQRDVAQRAVATIAREPNEEHAQAGFRFFSAIDVLIRDEWMDGLLAGHVYEFCGQLVASSTSSAWSRPLFDCTYMEPASSALAALARTVIPIQLPSHLLPLVRTDTPSPWLLTAAMARDFLSDTLPHGSFSHVRMGLLLSLASLSQSEPLHILISTDDTLLTASILSAASAFAERCFHLQPFSLPLKTALAASGDGLLLANEIQGMSTKDSQLLEAMEKKEANGQPLESCVWASSDVNVKRKTSVARLVAGKGKQLIE